MDTTPKSRPSGKRSGQPAPQMAIGWPVPLRLRSKWAAALGGGCRSRAAMGKGTPGPWGTPVPRADLSYISQKAEGVTEKSPKTVGPSRDASPKGRKAQCRYLQPAFFGMKGRAIERGCGGLRGLSSWSGSRSRLVSLQLDSRQSTTISSELIRTTSPLGETNST